MGGSYSQEVYEWYAHEMYRYVLHEPCILPDVAIDESLLKYSGPDSNAALQAFSNEKLILMPGYVRSLGSALGSLNSVPNAVGLGALVISMIIEIVIKSGTQTRDKTDTYSLLRQVFGEEKASDVRDTMAEYLKRHQVFMNNDQRLREEIRRLEQQLSKDLTVLRNSLLQDRQMSSRGFKIWVNGAAFHLQMLIHEARLEIQAGKPASDCVREIETAIDVYLRYLDLLLEKYKTFMLNLDIFRTQVQMSVYDAETICRLKNDEIEKCWTYFLSSNIPCYHQKEVMAPFVDLVYSKYEPITGLKSYFLNIKNNLYSRIRERGSFTLPSAAG